MNMVIVLEILLGLVVLGAAVRFAVRDTRLRRGATEPDDAGEALARDGEREAEQDASEAADQREGEEVATVSAAATDPEPPAAAR
ncbi:MAG: hypothetical protein ACRDS1_03455 [Pseudonocardiaceae bacterium]